MKNVYFYELENRMDEYCKTCHTKECRKCTQIPRNFLKDGEIQKTIEKHGDDIMFNYDLKKKEGI